MSVRVLFESLGTAVAFVAIPSRHTLVINSDAMPDRPLQGEEYDRMIETVTELIGSEPTGD